MIISPSAFAERAVNFVRRRKGTRKGNSDGTKLEDGKARKEHFFAALREYCSNPICRKILNIFITGQPTRAKKVVVVGKMCFRVSVVISFRGGRRGYDETEECARFVSLLFALKQVKWMTEAMQRKNSFPAGFRFSPCKVEGAK